MWYVLGCSALAASAAFAITPLIERWAWQVGFLDRPDASRKLQKLPVAFGGGIAVFAAIMCGLMLALSHPGMRDHAATLVVLLCGALAILALGIYDDCMNLSGRAKLAAQLVIALAITFSPWGGTDVATVRLSFMSVSSPLVAKCIVTLWLLGCINSFNLMDGVDGFATTLGLVFSVTLGAIALLQGGGNIYLMLMSFILAGALAGFLRYNWAPARIYLGDAGSMLIGLILGHLVIRCNLKEASTVAFSVPLAIFAIPFLDSAAAFLRRKLTGRSMYQGDRGHLHHRLVMGGLSPRQTVAFVGLLSTVTGAGAAVSIAVGRPWIGITTSSLIVAFLLVSHTFGHIEFLLLRNFFFRVLRRFGWQHQSVVNHVVRLQGNRHWDMLWFGLVESAERFGLSHMRFNLYLPSLQEDFHAEWSAGNQYGSAPTWNMSIPLIVKGRDVGNISVRGLSEPGTNPCETMVGLLDFIQTLQPQLQELIEPAAIPMATPANEPSILVPSR